MPVSADVNDNASALDTQAVNNFREYLRIPSVHPHVNYDACVAFLKAQADGLGLPFHLYYCFPNKPIVVVTWVGRDPDLPTILLNSHMDVVPVVEEKWTHKPFSADIDHDGNVFGRGSQDMKCVGIQYLEAIRRLKNRGVILKRTVHVSFTPDEEIGGFEGMGEFVKTKDFEDLNVGCALDEGMSSPDSNYVLFYGERISWHLRIHCPGQAGHGSLLADDTAGEKARYILDRFFDFRAQEKKRLEDDPSLTLGDVTSINLTQLGGGSQANVLPQELVLLFDCRIPITVDLNKWEETINQWCREAGSGVRIEYEQKYTQSAVTKLDDSNPFWVAFKQATNKLNLSVKPQIFPAGTDSYYIREVGIPAIGFSPIHNTPILMHDHDEFLNVNVFLSGIEIYAEILLAIANVENVH